MKPLEVTRYYSVGREQLPETAIAKLEKLREKYPDREYIVLSNTRASSWNRALQIAQVKRVTLEVLEQGVDYHLPPEPDFRDFPVYSVYTMARDAWRAERSRKRGDPEAALKGGLN